jgi:hypothetical protein
VNAAGCANESRNVAIRVVTAEPKHLRVVQIDESVVIREQCAADDTVRDCKRHERGENANRWTGVFG